MTEGRLAWDTAAVICRREARGGPGSAGRVTSGPGLSEGTRTLGAPQPQRRNYSLLPGQEDSWSTEPGGGRASRDPIRQL